MWNRLKSSSDLNVAADILAESSTEVDDSGYTPKFAKKDESPAHIAFAAALTEKDKE
jgi:hypothetical protein